MATTAKIGIPLAAMTGLLIASMWTPVGAQDVIQVSQIRQTNLRAYQGQCAREGRTDAEETRTVEDRDEARRLAIILTRNGELSDDLMLARMCYGEASARVDVNDCAAILAVVDKKRRSRSRAEMIATYGPRRVYPHPDDVRQRWISELQANGKRPPSWPGITDRAFPAWRSWGCPRWVRVLEHAKGLIRRHPRSIGNGPCSEAPDHWGGEMDDHRAIRAGFIPVNCGNTLNNFWRVPDRNRG